MIDLPNQINCKTKAFFKKCPLGERKLFKNSNCIIPISVGQQLAFHEGDKFIATLNLINTSFKSCTLLIDDSIQRHSMKLHDIDTSEKILQDNAIKEGDLWLLRNKHAIEKLNISFNITRWNDWLKHKDYLQQLNIVKKLYQENAQYKLALDATIYEYINRISKRKILPITKSEAFNYCLEYLLEECAVMCLWSKEGYNVEVYPSGRNKAMQATYDFIIEPGNYPGKLISVALYFRKKSK